MYEGERIAGPQDSAQVAWGEVAETRGIDSCTASLSPDTGASVCSSCKARKATLAGLCGVCRFTLFGSKRRKYPPLTTALTKELSLEYLGTVREVTSNLQRISTRTGLPVDHLKQEARLRGFRTRRERRPWTERELLYLQQSLGAVSLERIARSLNRSTTSVRCRAEKLNLSYGLVDGYSIADLCRCFGLSHGRIEGWVSRGWLGEPDGRGGRGGKLWFSEANVVRFIRTRPQEYDLVRVSQEWYKTMAFKRQTEEEDDFTCP